VSLDVEPGDADVLASPVKCPTDDTSTWIAATSIRAPLAAGSGMSVGNRPTATAAEMGATTRRQGPLPHRSIASSKRPAIRSTLKDRPQTPVTDASGSVGASSWVVPSWPQPNPPSG
jgi:hypothetical protein